MKKVVFAVVSCFNMVVSAVTLTGVSAHQRWPWNNLIDIDFNIGGASADATFKIDVKATYANGTQTLIAKRFATDPVVKGGENRITWDIGLDCPNFKADDLRVAVTATPFTNGTDGAWMIIDLSGGKDATSYPVRYTTTPPEHTLGAANEPCQTTEMWLKRIKGGSFMFCAGDVNPGYFRVNLTKDYYMGIFECTQQQWAQVTGNWPSSFSNTAYRASRPYDVASRQNVFGENGWPSDQTPTSSSFINKMRARRDSTYRFNADSLDRDITTAFIGHSTEWSTWTRRYTDAISDDAGAAFYNNVFRYGPASMDSLRTMRLDNKVYLRLQPWSSEGVVSKLDVGIGDYLEHDFDSTTVRPTTNVENSVYLYAGAEGQLRGNAFWNAKARFVVLGADIGDLEVEANAEFRFYPFRRARKSPVSLSASFGTSLLEPGWYQEHLNLNHFSWDNDFNKISTTTVRGRLDIPYWNLSADVGYALLGNTVYYDTQGIARQHGPAMSILSASLRKEFVLGPVHLDHRALLQLSSEPEIVPLPTLALNLRYYLQFVVQRDERRRNVMVMQIGADAYANTPWYAPAWNPNFGVFYNQAERQYTNGPWFDIFVNVQWKRACVFIKYQNAGGGWPLLHPDYFSADRYIVTKSGMEGLKFGIYWPFYIQPGGRSSSGTGR